MTCRGGKAHRVTNHTLLERDDFVMTSALRTIEAADDYDPPLDVGIRTAVHALRAAGIETFESCEGGPGHAYLEPTVRFHGDRGEGFRALAVGLQAGLPVTG